MSVEQRLSELQSKAQAVADECHRLGLLVNQGVKTTDSPDFAGLTVGSNTVWHAGNTPRLLWSGYALDAAVIFVPDFDTYSLYRVRLGVSSSSFIGVSVLAFRDPDTGALGGIGGYTPSTGGVITYGLWAQSSGRWVTLETAGEMRHNDSAQHGVFTKRGVREIYGIL